MAKMQLVLLDADTYFGGMLSAYIRSSEFAERFSFHWFTSRAEGFRFVEETRQPQIVLVHEAWLPLHEALFALKTGCTVIVSETERTGGVLEYPVLFKYQPLNRLLSSVASHYNEYSYLEPLRGSKRSGVITVYSAVGGSGKTVTAVHLAAQLAEHGERTICLSLERLPSRGWYETEPMESETSETFSRLLYYAKTRPEQIPAKLEQLKRTHPTWKYDFIPPLTHPAEWDDIEACDIRRLFEGIVKAGIYDRIIVDADSSDGPLTTELLKVSGLVLWPLTDDVIQLQKSKDWFESRRLRHQQEAEELQAKVRFVLNRFTGTQANDMASYSFKVSARLPYVPEWKNVAQADRMLLRGFADEAAALVRGGGSP
ncbi:hypothetical protein [Paenibacillus validus]|uniref:ParA family protein n=1 Tax=Paenibacillus validus TaxID=44253 RepID=A0A7X2Z8L2_9BACL|nr:hypothetical protein [Paenibacillus validus]MUG69616.1 hypothetical protein [Paenibacillus validus]